MVTSYLPLVLMFGIALSVALGGIVMSAILGKRARKSEAKDKPYECGKDIISPSQARFSVKFYLVAMIFILFDIEVIFMYPWALSYRDLVGAYGMQVFFAMLAFILLLEVAHWYAYKKGVFDWNRR